MRYAKLLWLALPITLAACSSMTTTQERTLSAGAGGAVGGAMLGAIGGNAGLGAVAGASAGLLGGYLYDQYKKSEEASYQEGYNAAKQSSAH